VTDQSWAVRLSSQAAKTLTDPTQLALANLYAAATWDYIANSFDDFVIASSERTRVPINTGCQEPCAPRRTSAPAPGAGPPATTATPSADGRFGADTLRSSPAPASADPSPALPPADAPGPLPGAAAAEAAGSAPGSVPAVDAAPRPEAGPDGDEPPACNPRSAALAARIGTEVGKEEAATADAAPVGPPASGQGPDAALWDDDALPLFPLQPPRTDRELLADHVTAMVCCAAMDTVGATPGLDWLDGPTLLVDGERVADLAPRVLSLVEDGDAVPLRTWLVELGIRPEKPVRLG